MKFMILLLVNFKKDILTDSYLFLAMALQVIIDLMF